MRNHPMAVSTYYVQWGVQLGRKAPQLGPVLNHVRRRRDEKPTKRVGTMGGWIGMLAGYPMAASGNVLATATMHAHDAIAPCVGTP